jgi:hypothetical protein
MGEDTLPLIAQHPEHCFECFRLIRPGETYYQTAENTVLCQQCVRKGVSMEVLDTIQATDDLVVEVGEDRLRVRRGDTRVEVLLTEVRHLVDALGEAAARAVNLKIHGSVEPEETTPETAQAEEETAAVPDWLARILAMTDEEVEALLKASEGQYTEEQLDALGKVYGLLIELARSKRRAPRDGKGDNGHGQA